MCLSWSLLYSFICASCMDSLCVPTALLCEICSVLTCICPLRSASCIERSPLDADACFFALEHAVRVLSHVCHGCCVHLNLFCVLHAYLFLTHACSGLKLVFCVECLAKMLGICCQCVHYESVIPVGKGPHNCGAH